MRYTGKPMRPVIIESPFAGDTAKNLKYLRAAIRDCLMKGYAPMASHAIYTQPGVLDDRDEYARRIGLFAGWSWMHHADIVFAYIDLGITPGMEAGMQRAIEIGVPIQKVMLGQDWESHVENLTTSWPRGE